MLGDKQWKSVMTSAEQMTQEERKHWLSSLHQQRVIWRNGSADYRLMHRKQHHQLLVTGLYNSIESFILSISRTFA